jgi:hypothetical protein
VPDQGHAPLLEGQLVRQIVRFVEKCETASQHESAAEKSALLQVAAGHP